MILLLLLLVGFSWSDVPLKSVIQDVEQTTSFRFLYRDALVAPVRVTLSTTEERILADLETHLKTKGIGMQVDVASKQIILYAASVQGRSGAPVQGTVLDDATGSRLPYATVMWLTEGQWAGVVTDDQGRFSFPYPKGSLQQTILVRYVGYEPRSVSLSAEAASINLAIRLIPETLTGSEIVIERRSVHSSADSLWITMSSSGGTTGFSEPGALRALQPLASVAAGGAISGGMFIRGSKPDGFQILLDGVPVYNQSHLFGLFDPFNQDALNALGFYYGITPATYAGLPGGTLSYTTKTASHMLTKGSFGLSNSAFRGTVEVPILTGRASLLISGRKSYLNNINWFGNESLIRWGLDVDRATSEPETSPTVDSRTVTPNGSDARFHDIHLKAYYEEREGAHWAASFYSGGDKTWQNATRLFRRPGTLQFESEEVETRNAWGSLVGSLQRHWRVSPTQRMNALVAISNYDASYSKDDFLYVRYNRNNDRFIPSLNLFSQRNSLLEIRANVQSDWFPAPSVVISSGMSVASIGIDYEEQSIQRPVYSTTTKSVQTDVFAQAELQQNEWVHVTAGMRLHYFSLGNEIRLSPRLHVMALPGKRVRFGGGYSVNHQFLHSVSIKQQSSADIWISSLSDQPPSSSTHLTGGVYTWLGYGMSAQVEVYRKVAKDARYHEVNPSLLVTREVALDAPWFYQNTIKSSGIETQVSGSHRSMDWMVSYTNSATTMQNPSLNNGEAFAADWDRTHSGSAHVSVKPVDGMSILAGIHTASGSPNTATEFGSDERGRLDSYLRVDAGLRGTVPVGRTVVTGTLSIFNLLDRKNVWYRSPVLVSNPTARPPTLDFENLDVYDLGRLMSFDLSVRF